MRKEWVVIVAIFASPIVGLGSGWTVTLGRSGGVATAHPNDDRPFLAVAYRVIARRGDCIGVRDEIRGHIWLWKDHQVVLYRPAWIEGKPTSVWINSVPEEVQALNRVLAPGKLRLETDGETWSRWGQNIWAWIRLKKTPLRGPGLQLP